MYKYTVWIESSMSQKSLTLQLHPRGSSKISGSTEGALKQISLPGGKHGSSWQLIKMLVALKFSIKWNPNGTQYLGSESIDLLRVGVPKTFQQQQLQRHRLKDFVRFTEIEDLQDSKTYLYCRINGHFIVYLFIFEEIATQQSGA